MHRILILHKNMPKDQFGLLLHLFRSIKINRQASLIIIEEIIDLKLHCSLGTFFLRHWSTLSFSDFNLSRSSLATLLIRSRPFFEISFFINRSNKARYSSSNPSRTALVSSWSSSPTNFNNFAKVSSMVTRSFSRLYPAIIYLKLPVTIHGSSVYLAYNNTFFSSI